MKNEVFIYEEKFCCVFSSRNRLFPGKSPDTRDLAQWGHDKHFLGLNEPGQFFSWIRESFSGYFANPSFHLDQRSELTGFDKVCKWSFLTVFKVQVYHDKLSLVWTVATSRNLNHFWLFLFVSKFKIRDETGQVEAPGSRQITAKNFRFSSPRLWWCGHIWIFQKRAIFQITAFP